MQLYNSSFEVVCIHINKHLQNEICFSPKCVVSYLVLFPIIIIIIHAYKHVGIGIEYIRLVMGGSDFNAVEPYTYDDVESGEDFEMAQFTIEKDLDFTVPLIQLILDINSNIKIMASPWSAPAWMKDNNNLNGGQLKSESQYLEALAEYFVRFVQAYAEQGIEIDAFTTQNEPEHASGGYPTMAMSSEQQKQLIRDYLGPKLVEAGLNTEIVIWDHNWDGAAFPLDILSDSSAKQFVGGTGWHCYGGDKDAPQGVRDQHPDIDVYFTECSGGEWSTDFASNLGWNMQQLFIGQTRVGARSVFMWNMALDENHGPRVGVTGGCSDCRGVITIPSSGSIEKNVEYYSIAHFSKFVRQGAQRINSAMLPDDDIESVAFQNPDGSMVVVVTNLNWDQSKSFQVSLDWEYFKYDNLPARSVATFIRY